jgi:hypothetical protein
MDVVAVDSAGNTSAKSDDLIVKTTDSSSPSSPEGLIADNISDDSFRLVWNKAADNVHVASYQVFTNNSLSVELSDTTVEVTGLLPLKTYVMKVRAFDSAGNCSPFGDSIEVTLMPTWTGPDLTDKISIYPNPVTENYLRIDLGEEPSSEVTVELLDQAGALVYLYKTENPGRVIELTPSLNTSGIFVIRIRDGRKITVRKLVFDAL